MREKEVLVPPEVYDGLKSLHQAGELDPDNPEEARRIADQRGDRHVANWIDQVGDEIYARAARGAFTAQTVE